ncbi:hypothetical protein [Flaviaesturariibacter amylovorans]|uniref:Sigma-70 family RNA polymerase sigma factor n=1 Tax=Flaviaesturariibacter amylovorans TaxID=1084520 RepID=A0ABP8H5V1_9BACT
MLTKVQLQLLTDIELAAALCASEEDSVLYEEFVRRFRKELDEYCKRKCALSKLDKHIGTQICHDALERFRRFKTFQPDKINAETGRDGILVFLFKIATNLFRSYWRREKGLQQEEQHKTYFDDIVTLIQSTDGPADLQWKRDTALRILKLLSPKERAVVLTDLEYKKHTKYLPDEIVDRLSEELGIKKATIRKIRERAIEKIKQAIHEINQ